MLYRVEDKYIVNEAQIAYLKERLKEFVSLDPHMKGDSYLIRSIYFDNMYDSYVEDVERGVNNREKFRIRTYDNDSNLIKLELKSKTNSKTNKKAEAISRDMVDSIVKGGVDFDPEWPFLIKKWWSEYQVQRLKPVNIVEYERTAYVESNGNVRITFDRNISYSNEVDRFFEDNIHAIPALPAGEHILEIKYDEFLPDYFRAILGETRLQRTSFSKYYYSRRNIL